MLKKYRGYLIETGVIILLSLIPLYWLKSGGVVIGHDSMYVLDIPAQLKALFYAWNTQKNFGSSWPLMHGFLPMYFLENIIFKLTSSFNLTQKIVFIFWFAAVGLSMYILTVSVYSEKKYRLMRITSALLYMLNFYNLELWFIADRPKFSLLAALPIGILIIYKLMNRKISLLAGTAIFGLVTVVFNQGALPPLVGTFWMVMLFAWLFFAASKFYRKNFQDLGHNFIILISLIISMCLGNLYWLIPVVTYSLGYYATGVGSAGGIEGLINWEKMVSTNSSPLNLMRLQGSPAWIQDNHQFAALFNSNPFLIVGSFAFISVIICGINLFLKKNSDRNRKGLILFFLSLLVIGLFFAGGTHPPFGIVYEMMMRHIPGFAIFRSSYYKFAPLIFFSASFLFGFFISEINESVKNEKIRNISAILIILFVIIFHFPYLTADPFRFTWGFSTRVKPPDYVYTVSDFINRLPENTRILLLPRLDPGYIGDPVDGYTWGYYSLESFPQIITHKTLVVKDMQSEDVVRILYDSFRNGDFSTFNQLAKRIGITHILWRGDVKFSTIAQKDYSLKSWENQLNRFPAKTPEFDSGLWKLYRLMDQPDPVISVADAISIAHIQPDLIGELIKYGNSNPAMSYILNQQNNTDILNPFSESFIISPACEMCKIDEFGLFIKSIEINPYKPRFSIPVILSSKKSGGGKVRESGTPGEIIDKYLSDSNRILAEYPGTTAADNLTGYLNNISAIQSFIDKLSGQRKNLYQIRVLGFFEAQLSYISSLSVGNLSVRENLVNQLTGAISKLKNGVWMSDLNSKIFRYDFTTVEDNNVDIQPREILAGYNLYLDDKKLSGNELSDLSLKSGYHRLSLEKLIDIDGNAPEILIINKKEYQKPDHPEIDFQYINPSLYKIKISEISKPVILKLNEKYDNNWNLKGVSNSSHFEIDGYANGWLVNKSGVFESEIFYGSQRYLEIAYLISSGYIILVISILGYRIYRYRKS